MNKLTQNEVQNHKNEIDKRSQEDLARLSRHATVGHVYFTNTELYNHLMNRFKSLGGWTPELSKKIGW